MVDADLDVEEDVEDEEGFADEEPDADESGPASLEELQEQEIVTDQQRSPVLEDDDDFIVRALERPGEEPKESLTARIVPKSDGEFTCMSCFLVKNESQRAEGDLCADCV